MTEGEAGLHPLLIRQLRRAGRWPPSKDLAELLGSVSAAYADHDEDRALMNRAMDLASDELIEANVDLRARLDELERTRQELERKQREAEESQRLATLGQLAAGVGHEINNPLAVVSANLEYIAESCPPATMSAHQALVEAMESARRMSSIVRDLRTFVRRETSQPKPVDLARAAASAMQLTHGRVRHQASLYNELGDAPRVMADEGRLVQVLINLILNAAEASLGTRLEVHLSWELAVDGRVRVLVEDTGPGIPARNQPHIFEPFFTTKPAGQGTGLGLPICRELIQQQGGRLDLDHSGPNGSCFALSLAPAGPVILRDPVRDHAPLLEPGLRVMVIDDERYVSSAIQRMLRRHQVHVSPPDQALAALQAQLPDLVLCDLMMPGVSGMDIYHQSPEALRARFVFMTGGACTEEASEFLRESPQPVLSKPFAIDDFERAVDAVLRPAGFRSPGTSGGSA